MTNGTQRKVRFDLMVIALGILAFALREYYLLVARVSDFLVGDAREYWAYAWNLVVQGTFSSTAPPIVAIPDAYRSPGYPWLIAAAMRGVGQAWYPTVLLVQAVLGAMTCVFVTLLARHWMGIGWSLFAGLLLAVWPHHVAATNTLLSEVLFGFVLSGGLLAFAHAWTSKRTVWFAVAGAVLGYAWLVNPLVLFFPPLLALLAWRQGARRGLALMLAVFLVPVIAMSVRNALVDARGATARAGINLVQGSWPEYHDAANRFRTGDTTAIAIMREIDQEHADLQRSPGAGLQRMGERIASWPSYYLAWYARKPWVLWGWQIRIGATDISFHRVADQPFDRNPLLRAELLALRTLNPLLTTLTLVAACVLVIVGWRRAPWMPAAATGLLAIYVTSVHVVLQAEPRYATAYRGLEGILVVSALWWAWNRLQAKRIGSSGAGSARGN